jgi:hypothetical protein
VNFSLFNFGNSRLFHREYKAFYSQLAVQETTGDHLRVPVASLWNESLDKLLYVTFVAPVKPRNFLMTTIAAFVMVNCFTPYHGYGVRLDLFFHPAVLTRHNTF